MLYKYDHGTLKFAKLCFKKSISIIIGASTLILIIGYMIGSSTRKEVIIKEFIEAEQVILVQELDTFSQDKFIAMITDLNVKYPHIVMAQSILETGHWKSNIFLENHNLFGMKQARRRITTAEGTSRNHAYYNHWRESVYDYAFYQCRYLSKIDSEEDYFEYLGASYAEAPNYVNVLKATIEKENLKALFN